MKTTVLTFNIRHGRGMDGLVNLERIAKVISSANPDIVGLNEVDKQYSHRSRFEDQTKWLADQLGMYSLFGPSISIPGKGKESVREYGNAILSRYPFKYSDAHLFQPSFFKAEGRSILEATVILSETVHLDVFVTHVSFNPLLRSRQISYLLNKVKEAEKRNKNVIVMGDFNTVPGSRLWKKMVRVIPDSFVRQHGEGEGQKRLKWYSALTTDDKGNTFPANRPRLRLDYIFTSKHVLILENEVILNACGASDHLPVKVTMKIGRIQ